jgi:tetratricopeptide (TPR) repeat protein
MPTATASKQEDSPIEIPIWTGIVAIIALTVIAYWPALHAGFIWDDDQYVTGNALLNDVQGLWRIWIPRQTPQYYPMVFTMFWIEHQLWGFDASKFHLVNVLLHAANALLVWRLARILKIPGAWLIGAVFALHPVHVESVAWITERKNVLSELFYLVAAIAYLRFDAIRFGDVSAPGNRQIAKSPDRQKPWSWYIHSLVLFILALLSKSVTCSLPAALILMMLWQRKQLTIRRLAPLVPFFVIGLVLALNTAMVERDHVKAIGPDFAFSFAERLSIAGRALLFYPAKLLWPQPLIFVYERWTIDASNVAAYWPVALVTLIAIAAIVLYRRGVRGPGLALAFFAGTIFPALGFVNVYPMIFSFVADHFQYLASLGIIALVIGGLAWWLDDSRRLALLGAMLLPILGFLTWQQAHAYRDLETLWLDTLAKNDSAWLAHMNIIPILLERSEHARTRGDQSTALSFAHKASDHGEKAVRLRGQDARTHSNWANALLCENRIEDALREIQMAIDIADASEPPQPAEAAAYWWQLGSFNDQVHRSYEALEAYRRATDLDPKSVMYRASLCTALVRRREVGAANVNLNSLVELLRASPHTAGPNDVIVLDSLADAFASMGDFVSAARVTEQSLAIAQRYNLQPLMRQLQMKLDAYRSGRLSR